MKYKITTDAGLEYDCDTIEELLEMSKELKTRRTGRTTRLLFQALSCPDKHQLIVGFNPTQSRYLQRIFTDMLDKLEFPYEVCVATHTVKNFGRKFYFHHDSNYCKEIRESVTKYKDCK